MSKIVNSIKALAALLSGGMGSTLSAQVHYPEGSQQAFKGPEQYFSGDVQVKMVFPENPSANYSGAFVTFQPGARTAWHQHPAGQHMVVISGTALTGTRDGKVIRFEPGEAVWCPPDLDHWHGATLDQAMQHLVITGSKNGQNVIWKEKVSVAVVGNDSAMRNQDE